VPDDDSKQGDLKKVIGIRYRADEGLPRVILKGAGYFADDILDKGRSIKKSPLVIRNKELVDQLYRLPVDTEIRPELFELVATVLAHLYSLEAKYEEH
jgi:flagellar biosynthesis protein